MSIFQKELMFVLAGGKNFFPRVECACIWNMKLFLQTQPTNPSDGVEGLPLVYNFPLKAVGNRRIIGFEPPVHYAYPNS